MTRAFPLFALALLALVPSFAGAAQTRAFAFGSDFATGSLSAVSLDTRAASVDVAGIGADAVGRWYQGLLYVVNRFGGDNIQVIDPAQGYATVRQFSVGNGANPQDIAFVSPTKAYVSRYGESSLLIVNPATGATGPAISLAALADGDGLPEMARMVRMDRWLFVACQRLTSFQPANPSVIAVVDTEADTLVDVDPGVAGIQGIALTARNPNTAFALDRPRGRLLIGCAGAFGALDGGIEAIDPVARTSLGVVLGEVALGGDVSDVSATGAVAHVLVTWTSSNALIAWDPALGQVADTLHVASGGFSLPDFEANDRGELWVCHNSFTSPGLLVFRISDGALIAGPIATGLPPLYLTFDGETHEVTGVPIPPTAGALTLAPPRPNPARERALLRWEARPGAPVTVTILDVGGRAIRRFGPREVREGGVEWDLRTDRQRRVPPGVYLVAARTPGSAAVVRRLVVTD